MMAHCVYQARLEEALARFRNRWKDCEACPLAGNRQRVVLYRGRLPAQVLFLGEGPGKSEDSYGYPFIGEAGRVLDQIIDLAACKAGGLPTYAITNVVACLPLGEPPHNAIASRPIREPTKQEAKACSPRLAEFVALCSPAYLVTLGNIATRYAPLTFPEAFPRLHLIHPAAILRGSEKEAPMKVKRAALALARVFRFILSQKG